MAVSYNLTLVLTGGKAELNVCHQSWAHGRVCDIPLQLQSGLWKRFLELVDSVLVDFISTIQAQDGEMRGRLSNVRRLVRGRLVTCWFWAVLIKGLQDTSQSMIAAQLMLI